ncbi:membrane protein [Streptococcus constellatus]|uniref:membrane protein n=1 Tax=Streptococcus constellatus TaxID=76860 RepID=UPI00066E4589|nr:membrane protein [Streptococcus constellatus]
MELDRLSGRRTLLFGILAILFGVIIIANGVDVTKFALDLLVIYFIFVGVSNLFFRFLVKKNRISLSSAFFHVLVGLVVGFLNRASNLPVNIVIIILGCYQLCTAAVYGITYLLYRQNKLKGGFRYFFDTVLYGGIGLTTIFSPSTDGRLQFLIVGIYLILLGFSNVRDGAFFNTDLEQKQLWRRIRINLPVIIAAFFPAEQLNRFNHLLQGEKRGYQKVYSRIQNDQKSVDLEVLVHTSDQNLFGMIGHVDICYQGKVISYGSYDVFSERLFGTIGDGVLFKVDKDAYIDLCKEESKKTLFGYGLSLTDAQKRAVEKRLAEIDELLAVWNPSAELKNNDHTYAYKLRYELGADLYKFKTSRFKTYFVLSTNCCLLADSIIGQAGTAILDMRGIIAPETYQSYLQYEFESANDLVVARSIYQ